MPKKKTKSTQRAAPSPLVAFRKRKKKKKKRASPTLGTSPPPAAAPVVALPPPILPMTINEAAVRWNVSRTTIRKWIAHGRVKFERHGGGKERAAAVLIFQRDRPIRLPPGSLTPVQRAAWRHR